jgi:hypothetical protein
MNMKLLDYLKAAAGESSLLSKLGIWRQKVSVAVEALDPAYIEVVRVNSVQTIADLAAQTTILFNSTASQRGLASISYNAATGEFTLQPGAYELDARLGFEGFDTAATDIAQFHWEDSLGFDLGQGALGVSVSTTSTQNLAVQSSVKAFVDLLAVTIVKLVSAGGQGGADVSVGSFATVTKIG